MGPVPLDETAALVALLRVRPGGLTWAELATEVILAGSAERVWDEGVDDGLLPRPETQAALQSAKADVADWLDARLDLVTVLDERYPVRLLDIRETPPFLFADGALLAEDPGMSVVGSRSASPRGREIAAAAAETLVCRGLTVIAGLAAGIDATAHEAALRAGGRTVAVIGTGIRRYYPAENRALQQAIARRGLVLSQFLPDAPPTKSSFPMRNATMSGYGLATIVVEAGEHSGARIQARKAVEHGRPVILTDQVASGTKWGADLVGRPGVRVVAGPRDLEVAIDAILEERSALHDALGELTESFA